MQFKPCELFQQQCLHWRVQRSGEENSHGENVGTLYGGADWS